jgi:hypothetical protein
MKFLLTGRVRGAALGAIVAGVAVGGIAYAAIPDSGLFHACYKNSTGAVRLVDSASDCGASETATQWSQSGQPGPAIYSSGPATVTVPPAMTNSAFAYCNSGDQIISGGHQISTWSDPSVRVVEEYPEMPFDAWHVIGYNGSASNVTITAYAVCLDVP